MSFSLLFYPCKKSNGYQFSWRCSFFMNIIITTNNIWMSSAKCVRLLPLNLLQKNCAVYKQIFNNDAPNSTDGKDQATVEVRPMRRVFCNCCGIVVRVISALHRQVPSLWHTGRVERRNRGGEREVPGFGRADLVLLLCVKRQQRQHFVIIPNFLSSLGAFSPAYSWDIVNLNTWPSVM